VISRRRKESDLIRTDANQRFRAIAALIEKSQRAIDLVDNRANDQNDDRRARLPARKHQEGRNALGRRGRRIRELARRRFRALNETGYIECWLH